MLRSGLTASAVGQNSGRHRCYGELCMDRSSLTQFLLPASVAPCFETSVLLLPVCVLTHHLFSCQLTSLRDILGINHHICLVTLTDVLSAQYLPEFKIQFQILPGFLLLKSSVAETLSCHLSILSVSVSTFTNSFHTFHKIKESLKIVKK